MRPGVTFTPALGLPHPTRISAARTPVHTGSTSKGQKGQDWASPSPRPASPHCLQRGGAWVSLSTLRNRPLFMREWLPPSRIAADSSRRPEGPDSTCPAPQWGPWGETHQGRLQTQGRGRCPCGLCLRLGTASASLLGLGRWGCAPGWVQMDRPGEPAVHLLRSPEALRVRRAHPSPPPKGARG